MPRRHTASPAGAPDHAPAGKPPFNRWFLAALWFTVFFFAALWPLFSGVNEPRWDARDEFYPSYVYMADSLSEGRLPMWDPYTNCGYPFHSEPHQPTLNPVALLLGLTMSNSILGFLLYWTLHWWWGGIGMLWLARRFGATPAGGLVAALTFVFSGFFLGHAEHTPFIPVAGWLPWVIGLADAAVSESSPGHALLAGFALGCSSLGGYPTLVSFTGLAVALWLAFRFLSGNGPEESDRRTRGQRIVRIASTLLVVGLIAVVIWSPVLHAFFREGRDFTDRTSPIPYRTANFGDTVTLPSLATLAFPFTSIAGAGPRMGADIAMTDAYAGILTIPLAACWFLSGRKKRRPWWFLAFFLFMFVLSLGGKAGLRILLYYIYPPLRFGRYSAIFRIYWILPLCLAAGLGFSHLTRHPEDRPGAFRLVLGWAGAVLAAAGLLAWFLSTGGVPVGDVADRLFVPAFLMLAAGAVLFALWRKRPGGALVGSIPLVLLALVHVDMAVHLDYTNSETVYVERDSIRQAEAYHVRRTAVAGEPGPRLPPRPYNFFNAQQIIKRPTVLGYIAMQSKGFEEKLAVSRFAEVMAAPIRYWLTPGTEPAVSHDAALSTLSQIGMGEAVPFFVDPGDAVGTRERVVPGAFGSTQILAYEPERIDMEVETPAGRDGFLLSTDRYAPGWKAWIDGVPARILRSNVYFRGIRVPAGRHAVVWRYEPEGWVPLTALAGTVLLLSLGGGVYLVRREKTAA